MGSLNWVIKISFMAEFTQFLRMVSVEYDLPTGLLGTGIYWVNTPSHFGSVIHKYYKYGEVNTSDYNFHNTWDS
jgi:hypothetical protein